MNEDKPTITPELIQQFLHYCMQPGNGCWGSLHIVLDDDNVENSDVDFCIEWAVKQGDGEGEALARTLRRMSKTQRLKLANMNWYQMEREAKAKFLEPDRK